MSLGGRRGPHTFDLTAILTHQSWGRRHGANICPSLEPISELSSKNGSGDFPN